MRGENVPTTVYFNTQYFFSTGINNTRKEKKIDFSVFFSVRLADGLIEI